jgi:CheY-like chemotaxis protein
MKVLIVDDNQEMRRVVKDTVAELVQDFVECGDGSQALAAYGCHHPDVVLMDLKLGKVDGLAATKQIKESFPEARIIVVSQWETTRLRKAALLAGAEAYVNKSDLSPLLRMLAP